MQLVQMHRSGSSGARPLRRSASTGALFRVTGNPDTQQGSAIVPSVSAPVSHGKSLHRRSLQRTSGDWSSGSVATSACTLETAVSTVFEHPNVELLSVAAGGAAALAMEEALQKLQQLIPFLNAALAAARPGPSAERTAWACVFSFIQKVVGALSVFWLVAASLHAVVPPSEQQHPQQQQHNNNYKRAAAPARLTYLSTVASEPLPGRSRCHCPDVM